MKSTDEKAKFIELRASGLSFEKIAKELGISKATVIKWQGELMEQISEAAFHRFQGILEEFEYTKESRIRALAELRQKVKAELEKRDLSQLPTDKLFGLLESVDSKLKAETEGVRLQVGEVDWTVEQLNDIIDKRPLTVGLD